MVVCNHCVGLMLELSEKLRQINERTWQDKNLFDAVCKILPAVERHGHASRVAHVLHQEVQAASSARFVPLVRFVVACLKKLRGLVSSCFEAWLPDTMEGMFETFCDSRDTVNKSRLVSLRNEWHEVFAWETLQAIDERLRALDANWPKFRYASLRKKPQVPAEVTCAPPPWTRVRLNAERRSTCRPTKVTRPYPTQPMRAKVSPSDALLPSSSSSNCRPSSSSSNCRPSSSSSSNYKPSPKLKTINGSVKEADGRPSARFQPVEFIKPPSVRRSTTETKLRCSSSGGGSDKENATP